MASTAAGCSSQVRRASDKGKAVAPERRPPAPAPTLPGSTNKTGHSTVGQAHAILGLAAPALLIPNNDVVPPPKKARKERGPNWSTEEVLALVQAKRTLQDEEDNCMDKRSLMTPDVKKWLRISQDVMRSGVATSRRDGPCCKSKWNQVIPEYKRISDYFARSGTNYMDYWHMEPAEKKVEGLPRSFPQEVFLNLREWYGVRPSMQPPHGRDLLSADDTIYKSAVAANEESNDDELLFDTEDDDMTGAAFTDFSDDHTNSTPSSVRPRGHCTAQTDRGLSMSKPPATPVVARKAVIPPGVIPVAISSSDTGSTPITGRTGSTGVRRKSLTGHALIADATRASGTAMTEQLKNIAEAGREVELSKIDLQMKLFTDQMLYQRDRDQQLFENARLANENAKLAILKQGQVVSCLAHLSHVLQAGLNVKSNTPVHCVRREDPLPPQAAHVVPAANTGYRDTEEAAAAQSPAPNPPHPAV